MRYLVAFAVGGGLCALAQLVMDLTTGKLTPAHTMVLFVSLGAVFSSLDLYQPLINLAGAGATVPLPGFGHLLVQGMLEDISKAGWWGILSGGLGATSAGLTAAIIFGYVMAVLFNPQG